MNIATLELAVELSAKLLQAMNALYMDGTLTACEELAMGPLVLASKDIREKLDRVHRSQAASGS